MFNYSVEDFDILKFFSYTTTIPYDSVIAEVDANNYRYYPNICQKFDDFYEQLEDKATKMAFEAGACGEHSYMFKDNKTVFQIKHKRTGKVLFIGRYDWRRAIGNSCHLYEGRIFDFTKMKSTDFISDVKADDRWMWQLFEV